MKKLVLLLLLIGLTAACNDSDVRPEVIDKLRTIGVERSPSVTTSTLVGGAASVSLSAYVALPAGIDIDEIAPFVDKNANIFLPGEVAVDTESLTYRDLGPIRLASFEATLTMPPVPPQQIEALNGVARVRFGFLVRAGDEEERIVGDVLVLDPDNDVLNYEAPQLEMLNPLFDGEAPQNGPLEVNLTKAQDDEIVKIQWFVTSGEVKNRFDQKTLWEKAKSGDQGIIVAAYPKKTRAFTIAFGTVSVAP